MGQFYAYVYYDIVDPPEEPKAWHDEYHPTKEECKIAEDLFRDFKRELAEVFRFNTDEWDIEDYNILFEKLVG